MGLSYFSLVTVLLYSYLTSAATLRRGTCIPEVSRNGSLDDAPAIMSAIQICGKSGIILLPENKTYNIRTPLDFTACEFCDFQLEGKIDLGNDTRIWLTSNATFLMSGVRGAKLRSLTGKGVIDAHAWDYYQRDRWNGKDFPNWAVPQPLFQITNYSSDINVSNITINNAPRTFMQVDGNSSSIQSVGLSLNLQKGYSVPDWNQGENKGIVIGVSSHVTISSLRVNFTSDVPNAKVGNCVIIDFGAANATVTGAYCNSYTGVILRDGSTLSDTPTKWVKDVYISHIKANTTVAAALYNDVAQGAVIHNVTWDTVEVLSGKGAELNFCFETPPVSTPRCNLVRTLGREMVTDIWFKNFDGNGRSIGEANLDCSELKTSRCELHFENWRNGTGSYNVSEVSGGA